MIQLCNLLFILICIYPFSHHQIVVVVLSTVDDANSLPAGAAEIGGQGRQLPPLNLRPPHRIVFLQ